MTCKDYELIAQVFKRFADADNATETTQQDTTGHYKYTRTHAEAARSSRLALIAYQLADSLKFENPKFNKSLFLSACGL